MNNYTFGTSNKAASRLEEIAKIFNPLASDLIRKYLTNTPNIATDLGCGPGFTTDMVARVTGSPNVYGLDNSTEFLSQAKLRFPNYKFIEQNVTILPFPVMSDFMYCRFLLTHLRKPVSQINNCLTQLNTNGIIVIEELENIITDSELFSKYLNANEKLISSQGANLYVGKYIAEANYDADILLNECAVLPVKDSQAAKWFFPNTVTIWKDNPVISKIMSVDENEIISKSLEELINSNYNQSNITWHMRRIILRRN